MKDDRGTQIICPLCGKSFPVRVKELNGTLRLTIRCPHCKRISEIAMQDIK